jgi:hypothetical protein
VGKKKSMNDALIGFTGFVGSTLARQRAFQSLYRSTNIQEISGRSFGSLFCAGAPGQKWRANKEPGNDKASIERLIAYLKSVRCEQFVLLSTVDVFTNPVGVDETSNPPQEDLQPYGLHRLQLEEFVRGHFPRALIVRLPGLVGPGLRKNIIFDFHHQNAVANIDSRDRFQFYPTVNLWSDIRLALEKGLSLIHLTSEPISVAEAAREGFGFDFTQERPGVPASYDFQSIHAAMFGGQGRYQYRQREVVQAVRAFAQSEPTKRASATSVT